MPHLRSAQRSDDQIQFSGFRTERAPHVPGSRARSVQQASLAAAAVTGSSTARRILIRLHRQGKWIREGKGRNAHYLASQELAASSGRVEALVSKAERQAMAFANQHGMVTAQDLRDQFSLPRSTAVYTLASLVKRGILIRFGKGRATSYLPTGFDRPAPVVDGQAAA